MIHHASSKTGYLKFCVLLISLMIFVVPSSSSAYTPIYRIFDATDGFSSHIYQVEQDKNGLLWLAQDGGGILTFDGFKTTNYSTKQGLPSNHVPQVVISHDDRVWLVPMDSTPLWRHYNSNGEWTQTKIENVFSSKFLLETSRKELLLVTDFGIFTFKNEKWEVWKNYSVVNGFTRRISSLFENNDGRILAVSNGSTILDLSGRDPKLLVDLKGEVVRSLRIYKDQSGRVLLSGLRSGLMMLTSDDKVVSAEPEKSQLADDVIPSRIYNTKDGKLWVGTYGKGVFVFDRGKLVQVYDKRHGLKVLDISNIYEDREGNVYITSLGGGLYQLINLSNSKFKNITKADGLSGDTIWGIQRLKNGVLRVLIHGNLITDLYPDGTIKNHDLKRFGISGVMIGMRKNQDGNIWIFGIGGAILVDENVNILEKRTISQGFESNVIRDIHQDSDAIYFLTSDKGMIIEKTDGTKKIIGQFEGLADETQRMVIDKKGKFVIATSLGIGKFDPKSQKAELIKSIGEVSLVGLTDVAMDTKGNFWFASSRGVFHFDGKDIRQFTTKMGLPNDYIYLVVADNRGGVWVGTVEGVAEINSDYHVKSYGYLDGMINPETNANGGFLDTDGTVWFTTPSGITGINPNKVKSNVVRPEVRVTGIVINESESVKLEKPLTSKESFSLVLESSQNNIKFDYSVSALSRPDDIKFQTRLVGASDFWSNPSTLREINFMNVSSGEYRFEVKACDEENICSKKPSSVEITIIAPYYEQEWFLVVVALIVLFVLFLVFKIRIRSLEKRREELEKLVEERTEELKEMSLRDPLTNLRNRRFIVETMHEKGQPRNPIAYEKRKNLGLNLGIFMIDIDHFKKVNDTFGHDAGDLVLKQFTKVLVRSLRTDDIICRWGGEEFMVIAEQPDENIMRMLAERIRRTIETTQFVITGDKRIGLTCSVGFAIFPFCKIVTENDFNWETVRALADLGLYRAKESGRNRWVLVTNGDKQPEVEDIVKISENLEWGASNGFINVELGDAHELITIDSL